MSDARRIKDLLRARVASEMNRPQTAKCGPAFVGDLRPRAARKTRSSAEGRSKKKHFYKPLPNEFRRDGFHYRQIAREGDIAIYEQTQLSYTEPSRSYEVIRIHRRDGFQISEKFIEPYEVYPNSEAWGVDGFTFADRNRAFEKFFEISLEEPAMKGKEVKNGKIV